MCRLIEPLVLLFSSGDIFPIADVISSSYSLIKVYKTNFMQQIVAFKYLSVVTVLALSLLTLNVLASEYVLAASSSQSGPGTICQLPDGSNGVIQTDGHTCCPKSDETVNGPNDTGCLFYKYINPLVGLLSAAVGVVVVIAIIIGGIEYSSSGGDPQRAASGRKHITNALLGLLVYFLLYAFLQFLIPGGLFNG